jgi:hypothetical protein
MTETYKIPIAITSLTPTIGTASLTRRADDRLVAADVQLFHLKGECDVEGPPKLHQLVSDMRKHLQALGWREVTIRVERDPQSPIGWGVVFEGEDREELERLAQIWKEGTGRQMEIKTEAADSDDAD